MIISSPVTIKRFISRYYEEKINCFLSQWSLRQGKQQGPLLMVKDFFLFAMLSVMQTSRWVFKMYSNFPFSCFGSISWSIFSNCFCFVFLSSVWGKKLLGVT